jgi:hypothetical protein
VVKINRSQREALHRVWLRTDQALTYRQFRQKVQPMFCGDGAVMVQAFGMWLGIEPDGYTHS